MGAGRSGSTIFGVSLGNCPGVFYAGELDDWLARSGVPLLEDDERRRFWSSVREQVEDADDLYGRESQRALERSASLFRIHMWPARRRLRAPYRRVAESVYRAIDRATGGAVVVDTSHYPLRARELQSLDRIDLHLVYLLRDPQSVVASFNRRDVAQYSKSTLTANVYLWLTNLLSVLVFLRHPPARRTFVRYEDFIADPEATVRTILERTGAGVTPPDFGALRTGIPFLGNRLIRSEVIALRAEPARGTRSRVTAILQAPWRPVLSRLRPNAALEVRSR
jgi:hypothetical protein